MANILVSLLLATTFYTVFAQDLDAVTSSSAMPPHHSMTPAAAPSPHHHHHHHHSHPPTPSSSPAQPPTHHHHHHPHPPNHAPVPAPTLSPSHPPAPTPKVAPVPTPKVAPVPTPKVAPVHPPSYHFPRSFVSVQGVVFCKSCKYAGANTLLGASPVLGATVKLQCNNTRYPIVVQGKTDKNGFFFIEAPKTITNYGAHKCKVFLGSSPLAKCAKPSTLHGGDSGAVLKPEKSYVSNKQPFVLFSVGPLAFDPKC